MRALEPVSSYDDHFRHDDTPNSHDQSFADNVSSPSTDAGRGSDLFALNGSGLRINAPSPTAWAVPYVQMGQGRKSAGLSLRVPAGRADRVEAQSPFSGIHRWADSNIDVQINLSGTNNVRQQFGSQTNRYGRTYQKYTGSGFRTDLTLAHAFLPVKGRASLVDEAYSSSNDLGTQLDEMPIIAPSRATGRPNLIHEDHMWHHYGERLKMYGLAALAHRRWILADCCETLRPILNGSSISLKFDVPFKSFFRRAHTLGNTPAPIQQHEPTPAWYEQLIPWLKYLDVNWLIFQYRSVGRAERYERLSQREHELRVYENLLCNTSWKAFLARFLEKNIFCTNRYDAHGKINFWPKRVFARYWRGELSKKELSPLNIPHLGPGERLIFDGEEIHEQRLTTRLSAASGGQAALKKGFGTLLIRPPELMGASLENNRRTSYNHNADYMTTVDERGKPFVVVKSSATTQDNTSLSASALMIERLLHGNQNWQTIRSRTCTAESAYPQHLEPPRAGSKPHINPMLEAVPNSYRDPTGLVPEQLNEMVSREAAAKVLHNLRTKATEAVPIGASLLRNDKFVQLEELHTSPQTITSLRSSASPDTFGRILESKTSFAYGTQVRASYDSCAVITTEKDVFGRASTETIRPQSVRKTVEVRSAIKRTPDGRDVIDGITFLLDLKFPEGHEDHEVNSELEDLGPLYKQGRPFHLLPICSESIEVHDHSKVARDICLTARMDAASLHVLRDRLKTPEAARCADALNITRADLKQLAETGFAEDSFDEKTLSAVMLFVCKRAEPKIALQFLQELCGGNWFATAPRSGTNRVGRIAKEVAVLRNELSLPENRQQPSPQRSIENLAKIEAYRQQVHCAATTPDVYTDGSARASERRVLRSTDSMLLKLGHNIDKAGPKRVLLDRGIHTINDLLAAQHIRLHTDLLLERARLKKEPASGARDLRLQEIAAMLLQMGHSKGAA